MLRSGEWPKTLLATLICLGLSSCSSGEGTSGAGSVSRYSFTRSPKSITGVAFWHSAEWAGPGLFVDGNTIYWTGERTACPGSLSVRSAQIAPTTLSRWKSAVGRGLRSASTGPPCCYDCGAEAIRAAFSDREVVVAAIPTFRDCASATGPFEAMLREATGQMRQTVDVPEAAWSEVAPPAVRVGIPDSPGQLLYSYPNAPQPVAWPFSEIDLQATKTRALL